MKLTNRLAAIGALAALSLAIPAAAGAHPGIYEVNAKTGKAPEVQGIVVDATGGTFKPSAGATSVAFDATADQVQSALQADSAIKYDNVGVTGSAGGPYTLTFQGNLATANVPQVVPDSSGLTGGAGTATASTTTEGGGANILFPSSASALGTQAQALIANDGWVQTIRETNGLASDGMIQYKVMPGTYRAPMTADEKRTYVPAQTSYQPHATCQGVAALASSANILAWQEDPFYNYIPWQKTSASLGDDPAEWIPVVQSATGVDLSTLNTVGDFTTACQGLGGTYVPADTTSNPATAQVAAAVAPVQAQVDSLTTEKADLQDQVDMLTGENADLQDQVDQLTADKAGLQDEVDSLTADKQALQGQLDAADADNQELASELADANKAKKKQAKEIDEQAAKIAKQKKKIAKLKKK